MITDAVFATAAIEGVPEWVKYVVGTAGTLIVGPLVGVLVLYLRRRLGVEDAMPSPPSTPTPDAPSTPPPLADEEEQELDELRAALADVLVDLRQAKAAAAEERRLRERAEARAERLQGLLETMAERMNRPPPPPTE